MSRRERPKLFKSRAEIRQDNEELNKLVKETDFEKGDIWALILAAMTTIVPMVAIFLLIVYGIVMLIFGN